MATKREWEESGVPHNVESGIFARHEDVPSVDDLTPPELPSMDAARQRQAQRDALRSMRGGGSSLLYDREPAGEQRPDASAVYARKPEADPQGWAGQMERAKGATEGAGTVLDDTGQRLKAPVPRPNLSRITSATLPPVPRPNASAIYERAASRMAESSIPPDPAVKQREEYLRTGDRSALYQSLGVPDPKPGDPEMPSASAKPGPMVQGTDWRERMVGKPAPAVAAKPAASKPGTGLPSLARVLADENRGVQDDADKAAIGASASLPADEGEAFAALPPDDDNTRVALNRTFNQQGSAGETPKPAQDRAALLEAAIKSAMDKRKGNDSWIARTGADLYAAGARKDADYRVADEMDAMSDAAVKEPLERFKVEEMARGVRESDADRNPASPENEAFRQSLGLKDPFWKGMNRKQIEDALRIRRPMDDAAARAERERLAREDANQRAKDANEQRRLDREAADARATEANASRERAAGIRAQNAVGPNGEVRLSPSQQFQVDKIRAERITKLGNEAENQREVANILTALEEDFEGITKGQVGSVPGRFAQGLARTGGIGQSINDVFGAQGANKMVQFQSRLSALLGKADSGLALSKQEIDRLNNFLGLGTGAPPQMFADAVQIVIKGLQQGVRDRQTAYGRVGDPGLDRFAVLDEYLKANPDTVSENHPLFANIGGGEKAPAPADGVDTTGLDNLGVVPVPKPGMDERVRMRSPDGTIGRVPKSQVERAKAKGYTEVSDG